MVTVWRHARPWLHPTQRCNGRHIAGNPAPRAVWLIPHTARNPAPSAVRVIPHTARNHAPCAVWVIPHTARNCVPRAVGVIPRIALRLSSLGRLIDKGFRLSRFTKHRGTTGCGGEVGGGAKKQNNNNNNKTTRWFLCMFLFVCLFTVSSQERGVLIC